MFAFKEIGNPGEQNPYYPYPVAQSLGLLPSLGEVRLPTPNYLDESLAAGKIPNAKQAGLVLVGEEHVVAFDHCAAQLGAKVIRLIPTEKTAVSKTGAVEEEGLTVMARNEGMLLRIVSAAVDAAKHPWQVERYKDRISVYQKASRIAVIRFGLDLPEYELKDINGQTGEMTYKPRQLYY